MGYGWVLLSKGSSRLKRQNKSSRHKTTAGSSHHICQCRHEGKIHSTPDLVKLQKNEQYLQRTVSFISKSLFNCFDFLKIIICWYHYFLIINAQGEEKQVWEKVDHEQQLWHFVWASQTPFNPLRWSWSFGSVWCHQKSFSEMQIFVQPISGCRVQMKEWTLKKSMSIIHFCREFLAWFGFWKEQEVIVQGKGSTLKNICCTQHSFEHKSRLWQLCPLVGRWESSFGSHLAPFSSRKKTYLRDELAGPAALQEKLSVFIHCFIYFFFQSYSSTRWATVTYRVRHGHYQPPENLLFKCRKDLRGISTMPFSVCRFHCK